MKPQDYAPQDNAPKRLNLYQMIHKSIRLQLSEYLLLLGRSDAANAEDRHRLITGWTHLKRLLDGHALHEDTHVEPLIEQASVNISMTLRAQHTDFDYALAALEKALFKLETLANTTAQREALQAVYLDFSVMMADYFRHLVIEETQAMPALNRKFTPDVLMGAHARIMADIPPQAQLESLSFMARSLSLPELTVLIQGAAASAPQAFIHAALRQIETAAGPAIHGEICRALNLEAA
jgi:hypothetical protein